jgi:NAD(P)H dehydrogenase (quinone)
MIVMTGTTGNVGGGAARALAADGHAMRQVVRDPSRAPKLPGSEIVTVGGLDDREGLRGALGPGDRLFMVSAWTEHDERMRLHRAVVDTAVEAQVGHLVYLSFVNASPDALFDHAVGHGETEDHIRASGLPFTFLRTSYYQGVMEAFFIDGVVHAPAGRVGWVDRDDCAEALAAVLAGEGHEGETYDLTGPEAPTMAELAARAERLLGHPIGYVETDEVGEGGPEWGPGVRRRGFAAIAAGELATVGDGVERLTGRAARSIDGYIVEHASAFLPPPANPRSD